MKHTYLSISKIIMMAVFCWCSSGAYAAISNSGFETDSDWTITRNGINAYYTTDWSSEGTRSFTFYRGTGHIYPGKYATISQDIDMTGVIGFMFDCQDTGIDAHPLNFLIDGDIVGTWENNGHEDGDTSTSWRHTATTYDIRMDLSTMYTGAHTLSIQMYNEWNFSPADPKIYRVDNVRMVLDESPESPVPVPGAVLLGVLGTGSVGFLRRRRTL